MTGKWWLRAVLSGEVLFAAAWLAWTRDPDRLIEHAPAIRMLGVAYLSAVAVLAAVTVVAGRRSGGLARLFDAVFRVRDPRLGAAIRSADETGAAADHVAVARLLIERRRTVEAAERLAIAIEIDPGNAEARYRLGFCLAAEGYPGEAALHISDALALDPALDGGRARLRLAECLLKSGRAGEAEGLLRSLGEGDPSAPPALHYLRALALEALGRDAEAALEADRCLDGLATLGRPLGPEELSMRDGALRLLSEGAHPGGSGR